MLTWVVKSPCRQGLVNYLIPPGSILQINKLRITEDQRHGQGPWESDKTHLSKPLVSVLPALRLIGPHSPCFLIHFGWPEEAEDKTQALTPNQMYLFLNMSPGNHLTSELVQPVALFKGSESYGGNEVGLNGWTGVDCTAKVGKEGKWQGQWYFRRALPGSLSPSCSFLLLPLPPPLPCCLSAAPVYSALRIADEKGEVGIFLWHPHNCPFRLSTHWGKKQISEIISWKLGSFHLQ